MTDQWSRDMDRRLQAMRDNPEGYIATARARATRVTRTERRAAKLRVKVDRLLGADTPPHIRDIAELEDQ